MSPKKALPSPWKEFLEEIDSALTVPVTVYCMGGFVLTQHYGAERGTGDIAFFTVIPSECAETLEKIAGEGSVLAKKYKLRLHRVGVATMPDGYQDRASEMFPDLFKKLHLYAPDPYDLVLSKIERNSPKDIADVQYLAKSQDLKADELRDRYERDLRPYLQSPELRDDLTVELWLEDLPR
jgi:Nucleotidyltransferase of unknown function (DUF6036)